MLQRIGILVVHGIGRQNRLDHLRNVVDNFARTAASLGKYTDVTVEMPATAEWNLRERLSDWEKTRRLRSALA